MSITITLHLWWLGAYLAVGVALWLPLAYLAYRSIHNPQEAFWQVARKRWWLIPLQIALWPWMVWEEFS